MPAVEVVQRPDHTYATREGVILPGITSRLRLGRKQHDGGLFYEFEGQEDWVDLSKGDRIHKAVQYALEGDLDETTVDPEEYGYVRQALAWIKAEDLSDLKPEYAVGNLDYGYATQIDLFCRWRGVPTVINWKTGPVRRVYAIQSALEALLFSPQLVQRLGVHLTGEEGRPPKLEHYTDRKDYEIAKAALTCAAWVNGGKR